MADNNFNTNSPDIVQTMVASHPDPKHDEMFGAAGPGISPDGNNPVVDPSIAANPNPNPNIQTPAAQQQQQQPQQQQHQVDNEVRLTPEAVAGLQSKFDKQTAEYNKFKTQADPAMKFTQAFVEDPDVRMAIIAEYHPDLIQTKNPREVAQKRVQEEFGGENFSFDEASSMDKALFTDRVREEYGKLQVAGKNQVKTLKQLTEDRKKSQRSRALEMQRIDKEIVAKYGWNEDQLDGYKKWFTSTSYQDSVQIYTAMMSNINTANIPMGNLTNIPGAGVATNTHETEMDKMFGTREPNFLEK